MAEGVCENCGHTFSGKCRGTRFCSHKCNMSSWKSRNPELVKSYAAASGYADQKKWKERNREKVAAAAKSWYAQNAQRVATSNRAWREKNRDKSRLYAHNRESLKRSSSAVKFNFEQLQARLAYWGGRCWMCGGASSSLDHVKPLSAGGPHMLANIRPACKSCNSSKGGKWSGVEEIHVFKK